MKVRIENKYINKKNNINSKYIKINHLYVKKKLINNKILKQDSKNLESNLIKFDARLNVISYFNKYHNRYFKKKSSELSPKNYQDGNKTFNPNIEFKKSPILFYTKYSNFSSNRLRKHHLRLYPLNFQKKDELNTYKFIKYKESINSKNNTIKIYIKKTKNNLFVTIFTNKNIHTKTITTLGFKGRSKQSQFAYKMFGETIIEYLQNLKQNDKNLTVLNIYFRNHYSRRLKPLIKNINKAIKINNIFNITPIPFNGCRKRKISIKKKRKSIVKLLSY